VPVAGVVEEIQDEGFDLDSVQIGEETANAFDQQTDYELPVGWVLVGVHTIDEDAALNEAGLNYLNELL
jgi:arabinogalactan endo-1,4-beta-galactosidase